MPVDRYAEKAAEYLSESQWAKNNELPPRKTNPTTFHENRNNIKDEPFHIKELNFVCHKLKTNKSPGPDLVVNELIMWTDTENRKKLLVSFNNLFHQQQLEESLNLANVASIYKKGDSSNLANYRPISLLQTFYKILAALIKERIDAGIDSWITKTQYGFRHGRSTAQAIYLARRLLDISEKHGTNLSLILLDWEKAFDKISHERLIEALERTGIPNNMLHLIKLIYDTPKFRVKTKEATSEYKTQNTGIRQGCPLSPYLFIIVMTVLFKDVRSQLNTPKQNEPIDGIHFAEILYADDTFLFGKHTQNL